jgi:hypothetical protein
VVDTDFEFAVEVLMAVGGRMAGHDLDDNITSFIQEKVRAENRVVLKCSPYGSFNQPPTQGGGTDQDDADALRVSPFVSWSTTE